MKKEHVLMVPIDLLIKDQARLMYQDTDSLLLRSQHLETLIDEAVKLSQPTEEVEADVERFRVLRSRLILIRSFLYQQQLTLERIFEDLPSKKDHQLPANLTWEERREA